MIEGYIATTDMFSPKVRRLKDVIEHVLAAATLDYIDAGKNQEQEEKRFRKAPTPKYDARQIVSNARTAIGEYTGRPLAVDEPLPAEAEYYLKKYLGRIARTNADLQSQIIEIWPDLGPGRELTAKEKAALLDLQEQAEELIHSLEETASDALGVLHVLTQKEYAIVRGTAGAKHRFIRNQAEEFAAFLENRVRTTWGKLTGKISSSDCNTFKYGKRRWAK
ncbi:hypothetical protein ABDB91_08495 [Desulfoscipio sp. XC116]|uniref:hypothetical protein n=1 Tax=Desulfoscipio sp. XC116 TaxID=3144975 RepID=UPI00325BDE43